MIYVDDLISLIDNGDGDSYIMVRFISIVNRDGYVYVDTEDDDDDDVDDNNND